MRTIVLALVTLVAALAADLRPSEARPWYPFCATYQNRSGITECSFYTYQQCLATVSGIGGFCSNNPFPPAEAPPVRVKRPRH